MEQETTQVPQMSKKRYKMSMFTFLLLSIAGGGFALKGVVNQFTQFGNYTLVLYGICILVYAIPYLFMLFEFVSMKITKNSESGYQTWMSLILGRKLGFIAGFFYFFVNLFFFLALIPNLFNYAFFMVVGTDATKILNDLNNEMWFKPVIGLVSIVTFWVATIVSTKGPKWLGRVSSVAGATGMAMTFGFIMAAIVAVSRGTNQGSLTDWNLYSAGKISPVVSNDLSWGTIGSISWALQSMGGLETLAAYKNDFKGGEKGFRKVISLNTAIFSGIFLVVALFVQLAVPADVAAQQGLLSTIFYIFGAVGFPTWWANIVGATLFIATISSLMMWTAAPVKMLFVDAPKGIFGKRLSKVSERDKTPINGLIAQGIIVTVLFTIQIFGALSAGMNKFLEIIQTLNAGASTFPVLFMVAAYVKLKWQGDRPEFDRGYKFLGKNKWYGILAITPMILIFLVATITSLIPSPEDWSSNWSQALVTFILGPIGIALAWTYCEIIFRRWKKKNPDDNSVFNDFETEEDNFIQTTS